MRNKRSIYYVCSAIYDNRLINKIIEASTEEDAKNLFLKDIKTDIYEVLGPFYKKRIPLKIDVPDNKIKFSNITKKAIYNSWKVNAFLLKEPKDCAYLVFIKNINNSKMSCPTKSIVVPISELRMEC